MAIRQSESKSRRRERKKRMSASATFPQRQPMGRLLSRLYLGFVNMTMADDCKLEAMPLFG